MKKTIIVLYKGWRGTCAGMEWNDINIEVVSSLMGHSQNKHDLQQIFSHPERTRNRKHADDFYFLKNWGQTIFDAPETLNL